VLVDLVRFGLTWAGCAGLVGFWYYVIKNIGTF
jgi:hypothetical protein